jgi:hypothetical protein
MAAGLCPDDAFVHRSQRVLAARHRRPSDVVAAAPAAPAGCSCPCFGPSLPSPIPQSGLMRAWTGRRGLTQFPASTRPQPHAQLCTPLATSDPSPSTRQTVVCADPSSCPRPSSTIVDHRPPSNIKPAPSRLSPHHRQHHRPQHCSHSRPTAAPTTALVVPIHPPRPGAPALAATLPRCIHNTSAGASSTASTALPGSPIRKSR